MKVIAVIEDEEVIYRILAHLNLLSPGDGPRAPPRVLSSVASSVNNVPREPTYEPVYDDPPLAGLRVTPLPATLPTGFVASSAERPGRPRFASRSRWRGARPPPDPAFALDFLYRR